MAFFAKTVGKKLWEKYKVEKLYLIFNVFKSLFILIYTVFPYKYLQQFEFQKT